MQADGGAGLGARAGGVVALLEDLRESEMSTGVRGVEQDRLAELPLRLGAEAVLEQPVAALDVILRVRMRIGLCQPRLARVLDLKRELLER